MDIKERSKAYANGKALDALSAVIEQAYADGFNDGMNYLQIQKQEAIKNGVEYVDLELTSGTLWSSGYVNESHLPQNRLPYIEASKLNIPTTDQFLELCNECFATEILSKEFRGTIFKGKNGNSIRLRFVTIDEIENSKYTDYFRFWLKDGEELNMALHAKNYQYDKNKVTPICQKLFMGISLPVMLVK